MTRFSIDLKALYILRQNVRALLIARKESESSLASFLGFAHRSSLNKFLNSERGGFQMARLDRLAAFFGLPVYQLFQPGISAYTERRRVKDRRNGHERRQGHAHRLMVGLGAHIAAHQNRTAASVPGDPSHGADPTLIYEQIRQLTIDHERQISALISQIEPRGQAAKTRKRLPPPPGSRRAAGGSNAPDD